MQQNIHILILIVVKFGGLSSPHGHEKICNFNSSDMPFPAFSGAKLFQKKIDFPCTVLV